MTGPEPQTRRLVSSNTQTRILSGVLMASATILVAWIGGYAFVLFWLAAGVIVCAEWLRVTRQGGYGWWFAGLCVAAVVAGAPSALRLADDLGRGAIFWLFAVVWATDIMAYFSGRLLGGAKLCPRLSPNKTWSGFLGGTFFGVLAGVAVALALGLPSLLMPTLLAALLSVATHAGDLLESAVKRRFGVKDAGSIIPGHGGLMDRLDGFALAVALAAAIGLSRGGAGNVAQGLLLW